MTVLIIGYPGSGKSELAEQMVTEMSAPGGRIYLATMIPCGDEGAARVKRHRKMREGKGFVTIEAPFDAADALATGTDPMPGCTVLLECLSNLVANELFERRTDAEEVTEKIADDILRLSEKTDNLVVVSNRFEIKDDFDDETRLYAETMDAVNDRVAAFADRVIKI